VAPRLSPRERALLDAEPPAARPERRRSLLFAVLGLAVLVFAAAAAIALGGAPSERSPAISAAAAPVAAPTAAQPARRFSFGVAPDGVEVFVDGRAVEVRGGRVEVDGTPGALRKVKLRYQQREREHMLALTEHGPVPSLLEAERVAPEPPASGALRASPAASALPVAPRRPPSTSARKKGGALEFDVGEFK
jgi:hypothetical protein